VAGCAVAGGRSKRGGGPAGRGCLRRRLGPGPPTSATLTVPLERGAPCSQD
jgi:hypothetical protein